MSAAASASSQQPRLPAEILVDIIELAIFTSSPCPLVTPSVSRSSEEPTSPFDHPLRAAYTSAWAWTGHLLRVSKLFCSIARPFLLQTLTLDTDAAGKAFFAELAAQKDPVETLRRVEKAWLGNLSALGRNGLDVKPRSLKLSEAAWYEECPGGFVVGHAYASRTKPTTRSSKELDRSRTKPKQYRSVSVYWAEEQLIEEVSDPDRSSSDDDSAVSDEDAAFDVDGTPQGEPDRSFTLSTPAEPSPLTGASSSSTRRHSQGAGSVGDPRIDRPHEPAWQTLYARQRRLSPVHSRGQPGPLAASLPSARIPQPLMAATAAGPSEDDLDPWDMQDAQERLAALATQPVDSSAVHPEEATDAPIGTTSQPLPEISTKADIAASTLVSCQASLQKRRRGREIYAYHVCTATLESWITPLFASLRSLRLITLSFYPGHILDDDKLEHMLRRILAENAKLERLLIRIVLDAASAGSRMRRFERTKTIAGAADRIGDERIRVMLLNPKVGEGELVALPEHRPGEHIGTLDPLSRRAVTLTKEAWWSRVLQQNHCEREMGDVRCLEDDAMRLEKDREMRERRLSNWKMFFPAHQHGNPTHLVNLIHHADSWPDHPHPLP
ncbi:uncharacterized protein PAN0_003d1505 [Moesziomyces antarcticus]|uniref:Uncharacterized protein n=1 Tax=Pseudozyma antarctica TaxID=84753 RepID=A0A5C3FHR1_PSEA2|nr:uncharacterized protein PAN0_003d1505 [Moesziomyces antarcticus]GAK63301.1 conserved hypothetical protein [Moesziomyces antarcticus]SPO43884.1 uncharacterized protein PSANT_01569 [Moesziomyces antarcticus]